MAQVKVIKQTLGSDVVKSMLHHLESNKFIKILNNKAVELDFLSENIKESIRQQWISTNVFASDHPSFFSYSLKTEEVLKNIFKETKNFVGTLPFSLVEVSNYYDTKNKEPFQDSNKSVNIVRNEFKKQSGTILRNFTFLNGDNALDNFYRKQRERKYWWRKFSALPGRFMYSNVTTNETDKSMTCMILAEFPWGSETVETIKYLPEFCFSDGNPFEIKANKRKKSDPQLITCETLLEKITFTYLCDSYEKINGEIDRNVLKFDKKLAPYKVAITGAGASSDETSNLNDLSLLLAKQIRKLGHSVFLPLNSCSITLEQQLLKNDAFGIPYTIILSEKTLKDGILWLRSRDTTLKEDSHVSIVVEYVNKMFM